jgi:hypothetical protein
MAWAVIHLRDDANAIVDLAEDGVIGFEAGGIFRSPFIIEFGGIEARYGIHLL